MTDTYAVLDIVEQWGRLNDSIVALVDVVPDDRVDWSPRDDLWSFDEILKHIAAARHVWLGDRVKDGEATPENAGSSNKEGLKQQLQESWLRMDRFLSSQTMVDKDYESERGGKLFKFSGNWLAFHLLEHDVHHRSDVFHYLALLEIQHPEIGTP
jgi:uncharacterized damage-inducible protein DinB